jgi:hypothetical protein
MESATTNRELAELLGEDAASFLPVLDTVVAHLKEHRYEFMSQVRYGQLLQTNLGEAMRIYWLEILCRAHFAASVSLLRSKRWIDGVIAAWRSQNYAVFMASFRGLLESSADSFHSLKDVPALLAEAHSVVRKAIKGHLRHRVLCPDLENGLIHFTHARRVDKNEQVPSPHRARQTTEYLESLSETVDHRVRECYGDLCEVTHPAASSVMCYAAIGPGSTGTVYQLVPHPDVTLIRRFCQSYRGVMLRIVSLGVVPPLVTLRLLNEFPEPSLRTEAVMNLGVEERSVWKQIATRLRDASPPATRLVTESDGGA